MEIYNHILEVYDVFTNDEELLRLLYYPSKHFNDDPLDEKKDDILSRSDKWDIIQDRIKFTPNTEELDDYKKCRICFYAGKRTGNKRNQLDKNQEVIFDILVHRSFHESDLRMYKIAKRINNLILNGKFSSFGQVRELDASPLGQVAKGYFGYRTPYLFGELNDR